MAVSLPNLSMATTPSLHHSHSSPLSRGDTTALLLVLLVCSPFVDAGWIAPMGLGGQVPASRTLYVDQSGKTSNFTTIQSAIDAIPSENNKWIAIRVGPGVYREKVIIPYNKPYVMLKGKSRKLTQVIWNDHDSIAQSPTFATFADNVVVKSINIRNSYNNPKNSNPRKPAVAALIAGDKTYLYRVGMYGLQDTLWDAEGRHYFRSCTIQGAVDFIFGSGQSIYEGCYIHVNGKDIEPGLPGFITAQGRVSLNEQNGFVFKGCKVYGTGSAMLGRPWRSYARVLFYRSNLTSVVEPKGWDSSAFAGYEGQLTFAEYGCYGEGANTTARVSWETKMSADTVERLTSLSYIDSDGWTQSLPI